MHKRLNSVADPLWYKDAVIYQLHIKSFFDANNDGVGDFKGLIQVTWPPIPMVTFGGLKAKSTMCTVCVLGPPA